MEKMPRFLRHMGATLRVRTRPASSMQKPAAIHVARMPPRRKRRELRMNWLSVMGPVRLWLEIHWWDFKKRARTDPRGIPGTWLFKLRRQRAKPCTNVVQRRDLPKI